MIINYLDLITYIIISSIIWYFSPKEELEILMFLTIWIVYSLIWVILFVYPVDLNISDFFNIQWNIKLIP